MNGAADRRTIAELGALYELEPSLRDVYVEGPDDRVLVEYALRLLGEQGRIRAYEISDVDVPAALIHARSLPLGCKGRVVALADELDRACPRDLSGSVVCLADLDLDGILGRRRSYRLLVYTSALSLDVVLATPPVLERLLRVALLDGPLAEDLLDQMLPILNERVLQRLAAEQLGISVAPPRLSRVCSFDGQTLRCDLDVYVRRYLEKAGAVSLAAQFQTIVESHRPEIANEPTKFIHMEDFVDLLHFCSHTLKPKLVPPHDLFRRYLSGFVDTVALLALPEIQEIAARLRPI